MLSKGHIEYRVTTSTSLPQFPVHEMYVSRRYSDFHWLHQRLCVAFPGCLIPRFPEKKTVGNMEQSFVEDRRKGLEIYLVRPMCLSLRRCAAVSLPLLP
jgi:sorting nexin-1/2